MKKSTKVTITIILFFIAQVFITGFCCKLPAEKYFFRDTDCKFRTINIYSRKLLDSQKAGMTLGKDIYEEEVIELFKSRKSKYSCGSRVSSEENAFYLYDYDRKTGVLTTYIKVCKPEPYNYKYLGDIAKEISEIEITEETVKKDILSVLESAKKEK